MYIMFRTVSLGATASCSYVIQTLHVSRVIIGLSLLASLAQRVQGMCTVRGAGILYVCVMCGPFMQGLSHQVEVFVDGSLLPDIALRGDLLLLLSTEVDPTICPTLMEGVTYLKELMSGMAKIVAQEGFRQGGYSGHRVLF